MPRHDLIGQPHALHAVLDRARANAPKGWFVTNMTAPETKADEHRFYAQLAEINRLSGMDMWAFPYPGVNVGVGVFRYSALPGINLGAEREGLWSLYCPCPIRNLSRWWWYHSQVTGRPQTTDKPPPIPYGWHNPPPYGV